MRLILATLGIMALAPAAQARPVPQVEDFLKEQITNLAAVAAPLGGLKNAGPVEGGDEYKLSLFRLRVQANVGFSAGVGKISLVPEAEFFWE